MKLFYGFILVLMVFISACAQQPVAAPETPVVDDTSDDDAGDVMVKDDSGDVAEDDDASAEGTGAAVAAPVGDSVEIRYVGAGGFDPDDITIAAGSSVTWINDDNRAGALIIFKDGKTYTTGKRLVSGGKIELELAEPGNYEYWWNIAFGAVSGKITVE